MADHPEGTASAITRLATEIAPVTTQLAVPRSTVILILGALHQRGRLRLEPENAELPAEAVVDALTAAGLRVVRS